MHRARQMWPGPRAVAGGATWPRAGAAWAILLLVVATQGPQVQAAAPAHVPARAPAAPIQGAPWAWGSNEHGELGSGTTTNSAVPVAVSGLSGVVAIAAGCMHSLALTSAGTAWSWGLNGSGQLGTGTTASSTTPAQLSGLDGVTAIAAGCLHSLALTSDGTVYAWGRNGNGQLGTGTTTDSARPVAVSGLSGVVAIAGGTGHSLALTSGGTVLSWGDNYYSQLGTGLVCDPVTGANCSSNRPVAVTGLSGVVAIAAGSNHNLALTSAGTVYSWGANGYGQLGDGTTMDSATPVAVGGLAGVVAIAAGGYHSLALEANGTVWSWGLNGSGQLGTGRAGPYSTVPVAVGGLGAAVAIAAGDQHSLALTSDGAVWTWGLNSSGQLGTGAGCSSSSGTACVSTTPVRVSGVSGAVAIAAGGNHNLTLLGPVAGLTPGSVAFGDQIVGTSSATQTITLANGGLVPLHIAGLTFTGANTGNFIISADGCAGATVAPGSSCGIAVAFLPTAAGSLSASLVILDNARTSPQNVLLSGTGAVPPTNTPVPPTNTPVPPTNTPVPPTNTPVPPTSTAHPASMPQPPPPQPARCIGHVHIGHIRVHTAQRSAARGRTLLVSVHAAPLVHVKLALHVMAPTVVGGKGKHRKRTTPTDVLYRIGYRGHTDAHGRFTGHLLITYRPGEPVRALVTVITPARCGATKSSVVVTLEPQHPHLTRHQRHPHKR